MTFHDFLDFCVNKWLPLVDGLHEASGGIINDFLGAVLETIKDLPTHEVHMYIDIHII